MYSHLFFKEEQSNNKMKIFICEIFIKQMIETETFICRNDKKNETDEKKIECQLYLPAFLVFRQTGWKFIYIFIYVLYLIWLNENHLLVMDKWAGHFCK